MRDSWRRLHGAPSLRKRLWIPPCSYFKAQYNNVDVFEIKVPLGKVSYTELLEWVLAAKAWGYKVEEFEMLEGERQSFLVAAYRTEKRIMAVVEEMSRREQAEREFERRFAAQMGG